MFQRSSGVPALATLVFGLFSLHPASLFADTVELWAVAPGTIMAGGASVTGSFEYDATANTYSDVNLVVSDDPSVGTVLIPADTYTTGDVALASNSSALFLPDTGTGTELDLFFFSPLTDAGGADAMGIHLLGAIEDFESPGTIPYNASISGSSAPEPGTLLTLGAGMLVIWRKRRLILS